MMTYLLLNLVFILVVVIALGLKPGRPSRPWLICLFALLVLTLIFDNIIIALEIVGYDYTKLLGVYAGIAPIEDFMYAILAVIMITALWQRLGRKHV